ncbi:hypothetical protein F8388_016982 [Cannabis sativa]|uniref:Uncharacterized protein n=1 Tax=Cannabis sativa TaxID=3483 RepID=A0A7J6E3Y9_CANSA|nr:hypothetical protein F8388_016982 [Cannabis sativa]
MGRTTCCSRFGLRRGPWTPREDTLLVNYIQLHGEGHWRIVPKKAVSKYSTSAHGEDCAEEVLNLYYQDGNKVDDDDDDDYDYDYVVNNNKSNNSNKSTSLDQISHGKDDMLDKIFEEYQQLLQVEDHLHSNFLFF